VAVVELARREVHAPRGEVHRVQDVPRLRGPAQAGRGAEGEQLGALGAGEVVGHQHDLGGGVCGRERAHLRRAAQRSMVDDRNARTGRAQERRQLGRGHPVGDQLEARVVLDQPSQPAREQILELAYGDGDRDCVGHLI